LPREERHLARADPRLGRLIARIVVIDGIQRYPSSPADSHFEALAKSVVYQQLGKGAAGSIYGRFASLFLDGKPTPAAMLALADEALLGIGLSRSKLRSIRELAVHISDGTLDLDDLSAVSDSDIAARLTTQWGLGEWTAQMFLMFRLGRPDVLPTRDVGIQRGLRIAHGLRRRAAPGFVARMGKRWIPYRSLACLYLWAAVDQKLDPHPLNPA